MDLNREVGSRLIRSGGYLINLQAKALLLPWHLCRVWLAGTLNIILALFHLVGIMPNEFSNRVKIAELNRHIDNMHQREDEYRRQLQVLSEQVDAQSKDKSKAIKKLQRARADAHDYATSLEGLQASQSRGAGGTAKHSSSAKLTHTLLWAAVLAVYMCSGSLTSLEFKLLLSVIVPVALIYFMLQTSPSRHKPGWNTVMIQCVSAGVLGFTINHLVC